MATDRPRCNGQIPAGKVKVLDENGAFVGVMDSGEALDLAVEAGLDLVEVSPSAKPPVCRVMSVHKWEYEASKVKRGSKHPSVKEVRFRVRIGRADIATKCDKITDLLAGGHRVRVVVQMYGREQSHPDRAATLADEVAERVAHFGAVGEIRREPHRVWFSVHPTERRPKQRT